MTWNASLALEPFASALEALIQFQDSAELHVSDQGLRIRVINGARTSIAELTFPPAAFWEFEVGGEALSLPLCLSLLAAALREGSGEAERVHLEVRAEPAGLCCCFSRDSNEPAGLSRVVPLLSRDLCWGVEFIPADCFAPAFSVAPPLGFFPELCALLEAELGAPRCQVRFSMQSDGVLQCQAHDGARSTRVHALPAGVLGEVSVGEGREWTAACYSLELLAQIRWPGSGEGVEFSWGFDAGRPLLAAYALGNGAELKFLVAPHISLHGFLSIDGREQ